MTLVVAQSPTPILQFFNSDGTFLIGGQLFTSVGGLPYPTYADPLGLIQHANPIILNSRGEIATSSGQSAQLFLIPNVTYSFALFDAQSNPIVTPTNIRGIPTADIIESIITASFIGQQIYPQTAAEIAAAVAIVNPAYPPLMVDRYGTNTTPGMTSMLAAWQSAINVAKRQGGVVTWGVGPYVLDGALDLTNPIGSQNCMFALIGQGRFKAPTNTVGQNATPSILLKHTGHAFDTTGSQGIHFENMSIASIDPVNYPKTCFLRARNSDGASRTDRLINCYVYGPFKQTIDANYGAENDILDGCQFYNTATDANASAVDINGYNVFRAYSSAFTTIATGSQSCLDHKIIGGEYANLGGTNTSDVIRLTGARSVKIIGPWLDSSNQLGTVSGRSLIYVDAGNAASGPVYITGVDGEANNNPANFAILFDGSTTTHPNWVVIGNIFPNTSAMLGGGSASTVISQLTWLNNTNSSQGGGVSFNGTIDTPISDNTPGGFTANAITNPFIIPLSATFTRSGEIDVTLVDTSQSVGAKGWRFRNASGKFSIARVDDSGNVTSERFVITDSGLGVNGTAATAKPTVTGAKGGNAALTSLMTALASYGLVTDSTT